MNNNIQNDIYDIAIIGAGIAGYSAALLLATFKYKPIIFSGKKHLSNLKNLNISHVTATPQLCNYPGIPKILTGKEFYDIINEQVKSCGIEVIDETVNSVISSETNTFINLITNEKTYKFKTILLATGLNHISINIQGFEELYGIRAFRCIACDPQYPDVTNKTIVIVGSGDNAVENALVLNKLARQVTILSKYDKLKASNTLVNQLKKTTINVLFSVSITNIDNEFIKYSDMKTDNKNNYIMSYDYIFVAIGHKPVASFVKGLKLDDNGYVLTKHKSTETNIKNIFACGVVANPKYQTTTATIGSGSMAATDIMIALESINI
jgi:thioredoxin reductase (NADPH)